MVLFETKGLTFSYPHSEKTALDNINLKVNKGEFVLLMGESGSGKSTLLRILKPELAPYGKKSGDVIFSGNSIGFVEQNPQTSFVSENVRGELAFALENAKISSDKIAVKIGEISSFFNIADKLDEKTANLSGGERAVVSVASAMINDADTLILDEPFSQLDYKSTMQLCSLLKRINEELGVTVILASHSSQEVIDYSDRIVILQNGEIICNDTPKNAVKNSNILEFFPISAQLFDERPLTVKDALPYAKKLKEKPYIKFEATDAAVTVKNLYFAYEKKSPDILDGLNFTAYKGKINAVIGANGSGKTTLLKVIAGIKRQYSGKIKLTGKALYLPQDVRFLFTKDSLSQEIKTDTAKKLGIDDCLMQNPLDLSAGQMQRLGLGILLEQNGDIFLLDEPSKGLDFNAKKELGAILKQLCSENKTVIIVSHDLDFIGDIADTVSFLSDGNITMSGERRDVLSSLNFFTTQIRRITNNVLPLAVSTEDIL
ncbi:MAG: ATP-binding cassette domain-containing protein [Clostridiales bacterium]|nr:ATP-binding cassette domain-containing protein [Clostridiales bacterium]